MSQDELLPITERRQRLAQKIENHEREHRGSTEDLRNLEMDMQRLLLSR
jgi:hypothetical protein